MMTMMLMMMLIIFHGHLFSSSFFFAASDFEPLGTARFTTDVGWGCMIRSAQMMLAQAVMVHRLGRAWRHPRSRAAGGAQEVNRGPLSGFCD